MKKLIPCLFAGIALTAVQSAMAVSIEITTQVDNSGTENVLFNDNLQSSGLFVQGNFSGNDYIARFTSDSGSRQLIANGGQATLIGGDGNDPFTSLTFGLEDGATFTAAVFNPDVTNGDGDGTIDISVSYILGDGLSPYLDTFTVNSNGQNFFRIDAFMDARITSITFSTTDTTFTDASQFRLGGFAPGEQVPDGGTTVALLGLSLLGMGGVRKVVASRKA